MNPNHKLYMLISSHLQEEDMEVLSPLPAEALYWRTPSSALESYIKQKLYM